MSGIGNAVSSIFGGGGSAPQQQVQSTQSSMTPWAGQEPFLKNIYGHAKQQFATPQSYYPGQRVVPFSADTNAAITGTRALASQPNQFYQGAMGAWNDVMGRGGYADNYGALAPQLEQIARGTDPNMARLGATASGGMLGANPYLNEVIGNVSADASGAVNRNAFFKGSEGSSWHAGAVADAIAKESSRIRMDDYSRERGYMDEAQKRLPQMQSGALNQLIGYGNTAQGALGQWTAAAPGIEGMGYSNFERLLATGGLQEGKEAEGIADKIAAHEFQQNEPWNRLSKYASTIYGSPTFSNSFSSTFAPAPTATAGTILGGALGGGQLAALAGINPIYGALGGAFLGAS